MLGFRTNRCSSAAAPSPNLFVGGADIQHPAVIGAAQPEHFSGVFGNIAEFQLAVGERLQHVQTLQGVADDAAHHPGTDRGDEGPPPVGTEDRPVRGPPRGGDHPPWGRRTDRRSSALCFFRLIRKNGTNYAEKQAKIALLYDGFSVKAD